MGSVEIVSLEKRSHETEGERWYLMCHVFLKAKAQGKQE